jgi:hypothetical protein
MSGYEAQQISYNVWYETSRKIKRSSVIGMSCSMSLGALVKVSLRKRPVSKGKFSSGFRSQSRKSTGEAAR